MGGLLRSYELFVPGFSITTTTTTTASGTREADAMCAVSNEPNQSQGKHTRTTQTDGYTLAAKPCETPASSRRTCLGKRRRDYKKETATKRSVFVTKNTFNN